MPASPKKCIGKKVMLTPTNMTKNCDFNRIGFIVNPVIIGNQLTNPARRAKTAPILKT